MRWTKLLAVATVTAALIAAPVSASADAVPSTDEVVAVLAKLTDPGIPAENKTDIVTPGFTPDEAGTIDNHLNRMNVNVFGGLLPPAFVVTDIQHAPNNSAGAIVATTGGYKHATHPRPIVLIDQGGHWLITHDTAMTELDALWSAANRDQTN